MRRQKSKTLRMICLLLCAACLLAACGAADAQSAGGNAATAAPPPALPTGGQSEASNPAASAGTGMFVQNIVTPQTDVEVYFNGLFPYEDGRLLLTGVDTQRRGPKAYIGNGDGAWEELKNPAVEAYMAQLQEEQRRPSYTVASDGIWWLYVNDELIAGPDGMPEGPKDMQPPELIRMGEDGQPQSFNATPSGAAPGDWYSVLKLVPGPGGDVYALLVESYNYSKICWLAFDGASGKEKAKVELDPQNYYTDGAVVKGSTVYVVNSSSNQLEGFSLLDGSKTDGFAIPALDFRMESIGTAIADNGEFCYADRRGIHRIAQGGTLVQDMVNDTRFIFAAPEFFAMGLVAAADGSYLLLASDNTGPGNVYQFVFDETATISTENTLSIWALAESNVLRAAIAEYSKAQPDVYVTVEYGRTGDATGATDADIIRTLNTRLLAGDVPDVLILDGLPTSAYAARGLLADLSGQIDVSGCYENIMQAYAQDGKVYGYPTLFQMPLFIANADDQRAAGIENLSELAGIAAEAGALHYGSYIEMFESLYMAYSSRIFPNAASVDETALRDFLENTKAISDALQLTSENTYMHGGISNAGILPRQGLASFIEGNSRYAADILWEPIHVSTMYTMSGEKFFTPLPGACFIPVGGGAIPVGAANSDKALRFIELMIQSDVVQELRMEQGFSVKTGRHIPFFESVVARAGLAEGQGPASFDWDNLIAGFSGPAVEERTLYLELYSQAERLYKGEITLEEAASSVVQNTRLYFEERA